MAIMSDHRSTAYVVRDSPLQVLKHSQGGISAAKKMSLPKMIFPLSDCLEYKCRYLVFLYHSRLTDISAHDWSSGSDNIMAKNEHCSLVTPHPHLITSVKV